MKMATTKQEIISFKVDSSLATAIKRVPNRSEFIRRAILSALDNTCPVCLGSGTLTPHQKSKWEQFLKKHGMEDDAFGPHLAE